MFDAEKKAYWNKRETLLNIYEGKWVAIVNGEVAAVGDKNTEVMLEAFRKTGCKAMYLNKVGYEKTALRKRIRQYAIGYVIAADFQTTLIEAIFKSARSLNQRLYRRKGQLMRRRFTINVL